MSEDILDVAIVGGGVSGCYCGYRLLTADPTVPALRDLRKASGRESLSVALYEGGDRIGGRLWSYRFPETPNQVADLGGMCFSPLHENVTGLCQELRLESEEGYEFLDYNIQYLRRHRFLFDDYTPKTQPHDYYPGKVPYFLENDEKWQIPPDLMFSAYKKALPESAALLDKLKTVGNDQAEARRLINELDVTLREAKVAGSGVRLHDTGFWTLLSEYASQEAYDMTAMSSGFYSTTQNWNSYNTLLGCFVDFCVSQDWRKLKDGYDALPLAMAGRFEDLGGRICKRTRVCGLEMEESDGGPVVAMRLEAPDRPGWTQRARNVILAIPQRAVQLLDPDTFFFKNPQFVADLGAVTCEPASKLFLTFAEPWWKTAPMPVERGQSATDLPIRLCYYLGSEANGASLLLGSFTDSIGVEYWNGYFAQGRDPSAEAAPLPADALLRKPPPAMLRDAVRQLSLMHGVDAPEPLSAAFVDWGADPYGGGYHFWNAHVQSWKVMPRIRRPAPGANVFLCGEAFSAKQGWVEGAINTAERTLETYFGLPRPPWLSEDYDLGP